MPKRKRTRNIMAKCSVMANSVITVKTIKVSVLQCCCSGAFEIKAFIVNENLSPAGSATYLTESINHYGSSGPDSLNSCLKAWAVFGSGRDAGGAVRENHGGVGWAVP